MFDQIARSYDLLNTVLSGGRDAAWRRGAARGARLQPGNSAVDVCTGTGKLAQLLRRRVGPNGTVRGVDFSTAMLDIARRRVQGVDFREGDATRLDGIEDQSVDAVTVAFGLRNVADRQAALRAAFRVLRPGGRCVILEFAHVDVPLFGRIYAWYLTRVLPAVGRMLNPRSGAYTYLPRSIAAYPPAAEVSAWLRDAGFTDVQVSRMTLGIVTLHVATRPAAAR
jgi:demethylmenaquinone methyltransferase/2-methoxy-6-polyprenyl-1,4-benzoquinol methylase